MVILELDKSSSLSWPAPAR